MRPGTMVVPGLITDMIAISIDIVSGQHTLLPNQIAKAITINSVKVHAELKILALDYQPSTVYAPHMEYLSSAGYLARQQASVAPNAIATGIDGMAGMTKAPITGMQAGLWEEREMLDDIFCMNTLSTPIFPAIKALEKATPQQGVYFNNSGVVDPRTASLGVFGPALFMEATPEALALFGPNTVTRYMVGDKTPRQMVKLDVPFIIGKWQDYLPAYGGRNASMSRALYYGMLMDVMNECGVQELYIGHKFDINPIVTDDTGNNVDAWEAISERDYSSLLNADPGVPGQRSLRMRVDVRSMKDLNSLAVTRMEQIMQTGSIMPKDNTLVF